VIVLLSNEIVGDIGIIRVQGELDRLDAPDLSDLATKMLDEGARSLVIDCEEVTFIDSTGLSVLIKAQKHAELQFGALTLRNPSAFMIRLLEITGLNDTLLIDGIPQPDDG
jgi:anti-sigma B factor antagonist